MKTTTTKVANSLVCRLLVNLCVELCVGVVGSHCVVQANLLVHPSEPRDLNAIQSPLPSLVLPCLPLPSPLPSPFSYFSCLCYAHLFLSTVKFSVSLQGIQDVSPPKHSQVQVDTMLWVHFSGFCSSSQVCLELGERALLSSDKGMQKKPGGWILKRSTLPAGWPFPFVREISLNFPRLFYRS